MVWFQDLSESDEAKLPVPDGWIRTIKISGNSQQKLYKNSKTGLESQEHPFIMQALNTARKKSLPEGWSVKEVLFDDGTKDFSYFNATLGLSLWDPPLLRQCLAECLLSNGFNPYVLGILNHDSLHNTSYEPDHQTYLEDNNGSSDNYYSSQHSFQFNERGNQDEEDDGLVDFFHHRAPSAGAMGDSSHDDHPLTMQDLRAEHSPVTLVATDRFSHDQPYRHQQQDSSPGPPPLGEEANHFSVSEKSEPPASEGSVTGSSRNGEERYSVSRSRDWEDLLHTYTDRNDEYAEVISHRMHRGIRPPVTLSGVRVLRADVTEANERIHQLLTKLRAMLCQRDGIECSFLYSADSQTDRNLVTLASDIVTALRQRPEHVVMALATTSKSSGPAMVQIAFTALHRLLHPFSTDNSMTTALLLQGINFQLDEMVQVEQLFSARDSHRLLSRALLVSDPVVAMNWNPLEAPLPLVPCERSETVLTCLLRLYAIRRDVTSYYRTIWRPMVPAIIAVLNVDESNGPHVFANLFAVASRLLECTLSQRSMTVFPATATAICRAMFEIGGPLTMHVYTFNLLILPNLVKVLAGDHESAENEAMYPLDRVQGFVDKYFDQTLWFGPDDDGEEEEKHRGSASDKRHWSQSASFNPLRSLIWTVWRLYSHAVFLKGTALTVLTAKKFVAGRLPRGVDLTGVPDTKLRNVIDRLRRKINRGCDYLLQLPLDAQGSEYLGVDQSPEALAEGAANQSPEMQKLLSKRLATLHFKPNEMLNLTVASRQDLNALFTDVGVAMELSDQSQGSSLYQAIAEYLSLSNAEEEDDAELDCGVKHDQLLQLIFLYEGDRFGEDDETFRDQAALAARYRQLMRGLTLANRYEDFLIQLIDRAQRNVSSSIFDLASQPGADPSSASAEVYQHHAPEFDTRVKADTVRLAGAHTKNSSRKAKQPQLGLSEPRVVQAYPLFSKHATHDHHPDLTSQDAIGKEFFSSYRFGSSAPSAAVGTSLGRQRVIAPKLKPGAVSVTTGSSKSSTATTRDGSYRRSRYTQVNIKPDASFLAPTESVKNNRLIEREAQENLLTTDRRFMQSMRDHQVIPTEEFRQNYHRRRARQRSASASQPQSRGSSPTRREESPERTGRSSARPQRVAQHNINTQVVASAPQPFPEHLRHRVRSEERDCEESWQQDMTTKLSMQTSNSERAKFSRSRRPNGNSKAAISKIIKEYQQVFTPGAQQAPTTPSKNYQISDLQYSMTNATSGGITQQNSPGAYSNGSTQVPSIVRTLSRTSSGHRLMHKTASVPRMPEPLPEAESRFYAPTKSQLMKMQRSRSGADSDSTSSRGRARNTVDSLDTRTLQELHSGMIAGLRSYPSQSAAARGPAFIPTRAKLYPPSGPRVPRVPDFLVDDDEYRRSRSRSRSRSRGSVRSRSNSFSNLSRRSQQPQSVEFADQQYHYADEEPQQQAHFEDHFELGGEGHYQDNSVGKESYRLSEESCYQQDEQYPVEDYQDGMYQEEELHYWNREHEEDEDEDEDYQEEDVYTYQEGDEVFGANNASTPPVQRYLAPAAPVPTLRGDTVSTNKRVPQETQKSVEPSVLNLPLRRNDDRHSSPKQDNAAMEPRPRGILTDDLQGSRRMSAEELYNAQAGPKHSAAWEAVARQPMPPVSANVVQGGRGQPPVVPHVAPVTTVLDGRVVVPMGRTGTSTGDSGLDFDATSPPPPPPQLPSTPHAIIEQPVLASPVPLVAIKPLRSHSAYSIRFNELTDDQYSVRYDANADREEAFQRRKALLCSDPGSDDCADGLLLENGTVKQTRFSNNTSNGESRPSSARSPGGPIPLIKRKSFIPGREESKDFVLKGFQATKHGRVGAPKQKFVVFKEDEKVVEWRACRGTLGGFSAMFSSSAALHAAKETSHISVEDILEVRRGIQTDVLKKAGLLDPLCCFSIRTAERTLDLTMATPAARDMVIRGLQVLLEKYPSIRFL